VPHRFPEDLILPYSGLGLKSVGH